MNIQTADLCDDNRDRNIQVLSSKFKNYGGLKKFTGQIVTVKLDKSNWRLLEMLRDENGEGKIAVVDNSEEFYGVVGDKLMTFAKNNNWKAIILNGYVRDTDETKNINVGLLAIGTCPLRNFEETTSARDVELNFGGVTFNNGDYIYADNDGVIVTKTKLL
ncbi:MAG: ribonuclease E activity regulator RraA [Arcobacter sp.]|jgi:regulator of ribonuclease activity A|uniref:4-hydroxy-4-methyl-2-oxoglutarate aldolase n=1 Tax=Arcobacter defluvii TaxID=873191 RepID=A0AAE7BHS1_9BACT|nr:MULTISPECIES: ribonuclease E activity regulator RraA [Arcobacter]MDY3200459.1 ribonuclease E activity regulator RraA [Arcobacter sp.]QKF78002.1 ribonuclease activity regulator, RraA family [Arcobacter defluvii]RXI32775.1 S-adenosylmethionine--2-demethylmenaquinone methyltransferase [Arcobacter defluvii]BAK73817.1 S-adenosylmethionine:2-demethylmenaquinone methyltransferase [Arcobacter sp. L]